jgi:hypothetical protein
MASIKYLVDLDLGKNELQNAVLQTVSGPTGGVEGQIVYDTAAGAVKVSNSDGDFIRVGLTADGSTITDSSGTISVGTISISNVAGLASQLNNKVDDSQVLTDVPANAVFTDEDVNAGNLFDRLTEISAMVLGNGTGSVTVNGDLNVVGNTTTLETANLVIEDNIITLNSTATSPALDAGIEVNRGSGNSVPALKWDESAGRWAFTNDGTNYYNIPLPSQYAAGDITAVVAGDGLGGGATSGSATLTNAYNRIVEQVEGTGAYEVFGGQIFGQFAPESIEVVVKQIVGNTFVQVITDVIVDMDAAAVKVFLPAGSEYFVSFSGIRA